jgi:hypothetical protein
MCHVMTTKRCDFHDNTSEWKARDGDSLENILAVVHEGIP